MTYSFPIWNQSVVPCPVLTVASWHAYIHSQEAGQVVEYSHLFKNFPQFFVIHTVKGFYIVNEAEVDVFLWNSLTFTMIQWISASWSLVPLSFLKRTYTSGSSQLMSCWSLTWRILSITLLECEMSQLCGSLNILWHCLSLGLEWKLTISSPVPNLLTYWA